MRRIEMSRDLEVLLERVLVASAPDGPLDVAITTDLAAGLAARIEQNAAR
jgi:hypothetical protein